MKTILSFLLVLSFFNVFSQDFEVSPLQLFFNAEPGEAQTQYLNIKNHKSSNETFILKLVDFSVDNKGKGAYSEAGTLRNSLADYISITPSFFELEPNEEKEVGITIQQPVDQYGSKWGVLQISTAVEQTNFDVDKGISAGIRLSGRILVDLFQTPGTNKEYKATIANLNETSLETDSLMTYSAIVNNLSDIITPCKVYLIATNVKTAEEFNFPANSFTLYPKSSRKIEIIMTYKLAKGTYSLAAILDYGSRTNLEGTQMIIQVE